MKSIQYLNPLSVILVIEQCDLNTFYADETKTEILTCINRKFKEADLIWGLG